MPKKVKILGVGLDVVTTNEALQKIADLFESRHHERGKIVVTPNPEMLLLAEKHSRFSSILNQAYLSIPDGIGILWASTFQEITKRNRSRLMILLKALFALFAVLLFPKYIQKVFPERVTGVDLFEKMVDLSRKFHAPIFLLGAKEGVAEKVKEKLEKKYPGINIAGTHAGSPSHSDFPTIERKLKAAAPQMLLVAYGQEKQELWIHEHISKFPSVKVAMGVGGAFDFIAGVRKRAPSWMRKIGIEWLYRLIQEPRRIQRIYNAVIKFPFVIISRRISSVSRASPHAQS